jgi:hypothetical protein
MRPLHRLMILMAYFINRLGETVACEFAGLWGFLCGSRVAVGSPRVAVV